MAITFTRAPMVQPGEVITASQVAAQDAAFNDRLRSGLGDPCKRIAYWFMTMARQARNPDASGFLWPANQEFLEFYQMLEPEHGDWPVTGPGEPEGANVASTMNAFVYGVEAAGVAGEEGRLSQVDVSPGAASTLEGIWNIAKGQRGGYDPATGALASPTWRAAREHWGLVQGSTSPHGNAYGGFLPGPEKIGDCVSDQAPPPENLLYFWTRLDGSGERVEFAGSCPGTPGHVAYVARTPEADVIWTWAADGGFGLTTLPTNEWIEGPYESGGRLRKVWGDHYGRVMNFYLAQFRGSAGQMAGEDYHLAEAFDFQRFFRGQWQLAPAKGEQVGEDLVVDYPAWSFGGLIEIAAGTLAGKVGGGTDHAFSPGFALGACMLKATGLQAACVVDIMDGATLLRAVTLTPEAGAVVVIEVFEGAAPSALRFRLGTAARLDVGGAIAIEASEIVRRKPGIHDAYLLLRLASARDGLATVDGRGVDESKARAIGENYFATGAILNVNGSTGLPLAANVNGNAMFEAARQMSQWVRLVNRHQLVGYEVEDGKSVLYFRRHARGDSHIDSFKGIGPKIYPVQSGELRKGVIYEVRSGSIVYQGETLGAGAQFAAIDGEAVFSGDGAVFEVEGIAHSAPPAGWTNEWLMWTSLKPYHESESSLWKPEAYADYFAWVNRCHIQPPSATREVVDHFGWPSGHSGGYDHKRMLAPESPPGYHYARNLNQGSRYYPEQAEPFYRSCRIYEPSTEVESATSRVEGGEQLVRLVMTRRLHHCPEAESEFGRDMSLWDLDQLRAEPWRSEENGIRDYLVQQAMGLNAPWRVGDNALESSLPFEPDNPFGSCYPHFFFVQLVRSPYRPPAEAPEAWKTRVTHEEQLRKEHYLFCMAGGAVDGRTTEALACRTGVSATFDYTFQNLCFDAFGGRWISTLAEEDQPEQLQGYGPLPNTLLRAEAFNRISAAVNKLTKYRVMLPWLLETRQRSGVDHSAIGASAPDGATCTGSPHWMVALGSSPGAAPVPEDGEWLPGGGIFASSSASVAGGSGGCFGGGSSWTLFADRTVVDWRLTLVDPRAMLAIPETWRDMVEAGSLAFFGLYSEAESFTEAVTVGTQADAAKCVSPGQEDTATGFFWDGTTGYRFETRSPQPISRCQQHGGRGTLDTGAPPSTDLAFALNTSSAASGGLVACPAGSTRGASIEPIIDEAVILEVPLQ